MFHGLDNRYLYVAYRVVASFENDVGDKKDTTGTGFFVINGKGQLCFVTNRHVDLAYNDIEYMNFGLRRVTLHGKGPAGADKRPDLDQEIIFTNPKFVFSSRYENDIACVIAPTARFTGSSNIEYPVTYDFLAKEADFEDKLLVCDFVAFPGFPPWYDQCSRRPILRTGTIASDPRYDYSWTAEFKGQCLAYEAFSFGGSSGSPVFAVEKGPKPGPGISFSGYRELMMIGINAGHLPMERNQHSGISYLYKSTAIVELVDGGATGAAP
ncbi:MAG TPA: hypothetical protein VH374_02800 [Polyangia bacterium]|jgi:hypothetical protein|nr:hypothetical protein [Polyangia bacterium]